MFKNLCSSIFSSTKLLLFWYPQTKEGKKVWRNRITPGAYRQLRSKR
jgi:hypothetical protein